MATMPIAETGSGARTRIGWGVLWLFAFSLVTKLAFLVFRGPCPWGDDERYTRLASTIWTAHTFGRSANEPTYLYPPLYSLLLSPILGPFPGSREVALIIQCIIAAMLPVGAFWLASRLRDRRAGWIAGVLSATYLPLVEFPSWFMPETVCTALLLAAMGASDRTLRCQATGDAARSALWMGAVFSLNALARMITFPLLLVPVAFHLLASRRKPSRGLVVAIFAAVGLAVTYSPWVVRNYLTFDRVIILPSRGHVSQIAHRSAQHIEEGETWLKARERAEAVNQELTTNQANAPTQPFFTVENFRHIGQRLAIMLGCHPSLEIPFPFAGHPAYLVTPTLDALGPFVAWFNYAWSLAMFVGLFLAIVSGVVRWDLRVLQAAGIPLALVVLYALVHAIPRYQIVCYATLVVPAGVGWSAALSWFRRGGRSQMTTEKTAA